MRAFLALDLPPDIRSQLILQQFLMPVDRKVPPENMHMTLHYLGDSVALEALEELDIALSRLAHPPVEIEIAGLGLFGKSRAHNLHARVTLSASLDHLHRKLAQMARRAGIALPAARYQPHVTLAYLNATAGDQGALEKAVAGASAFRLPAFAAGEITLYRSHLSRSGAQYDPLARYAFAPEVLKS